MIHKEYELQKQVCAYLNAKHPEVLFLSDTIASVKLTMPQGARNKAIQKKGFKTPDLIIFETNEYYSGLMIELKTKSPYKSDGKVRKCNHLIGQQNTMLELRKKDYYACFAWSYEMAIEIIEDYLNNKI